MEYVKLGRTGLEVSRICLGLHELWRPRSGESCLEHRRGGEPSIYQAGSRRRHQFLRHGEPLFNGQQRGDPRPRDQGFRPPRRGRDRHQSLRANAAGTERRRPLAQAIMREIDDSLRRLGTDYVDLYQIHRWDYGTPIEETLEALHDIVKAGKIRYVGASSMHAWQFARALGISERHGWTRFVSMQNLVNLLYRGRYVRPKGSASFPGAHRLVAG
jgi:aryl-alcohol dehydrogenase-like predicted oxidoreductase